MVYLSYQIGFGNTNTGQAILWSGTNMEVLYVSVLFPKLCQNGK